MQNSEWAERRREITKEPEEMTNVTLKNGWKTDHERLKGNESNL